MPLRDTVLLCDLDGRGRIAGGRIPTAMSITHAPRHPPWSGVTLGTGPARQAGEELGRAPGSSARFAVCRMKSQAFPGCRSRQRVLGVRTSMHRLEGDSQHPKVWGRPPSSGPSSGHGHWGSRCRAKGPAPSGGESRQPCPGLGEEQRGRRPVSCWSRAGEDEGPSPVSDTSGLVPVGQVGRRPSPSAPKLAPSPGGQRCRLQCVMGKESEQQTPGEPVLSWTGVQEEPSRRCASRPERAAGEEGGRGPCRRGGPSAWPFPPPWPGGRARAHECGCQV